MREPVGARLFLNTEGEFFDHRIRTNEAFREKAEYILMNRVRKGLIEKPEQWTFIWMPEAPNGGPSGPALQSTIHVCPRVDS